MGGHTVMRGQCNWGSSGNGSNNWGSNWGSNCTDDWGSKSWGSNNWSWGSNKWSRHNWGRDSLGNWVNETILVHILRESLKRDWSQTSACGDKISKSSGERSSNWSLNDRLKELGISFSLVKTVNRLITCSWKGASITRCIVGSVEIWVCVGGVQRIGFRLS